MPNLISMIAARQSIEAIVGIGVEVIQGHDVALANRPRAGLQKAPSNSAIVSRPLGRGRKNSWPQASLPPSQRAPAPVLSRA